MARTFYDTLMLNPKADRELITVAYRHLAKRYHPDKDLSSEAAARMVELNEAYAVLSDPDKRAEYDRRIGLAEAAGPALVSGDSRAARHGAVNTSSPSGRFGEAGAPPSSPPAVGRPLTFGRYQGWTLNQVARYDGDYIEWLSRTTMGRNYKRELDELRHR